MDLMILAYTAQDKNYDFAFNAIKKLDCNLVGFISLNDKKLFEKIEGYTIYPTYYINMLKYDFALIDAHEEAAQIIANTLLKLNVPLFKLRTIYWLLQQIMIKKYEDINDPAIQEILSYWRTPRELSIFNQYLANVPHTFDEVFFDENCGLPYINFKTVEDKTRRMYFPLNKQFIQTPDGKKYATDVLREQVPTSPHLYIKGEHKVNEGDVLIDAGVCEGNFALRYVDICSQVYLFEMDQNWFAPLYFSFRDCWDKIKLIPKAVSDKGGGQQITLDEVVNAPKSANIFLKMDIEGAEPAALRGARKILSTYNVKASVCSYHNANDALQIKSIFQRYGYKTWTSDGYMIFLLDSKIWETADFRKGIVYAENY